MEKRLELVNRLVEKENQIKILGEKLRNNVHLKNCKFHQVNNLLNQLLEEKNQI